MSSGGTTDTDEIHRIWLPDDYPAGAYEFCSRGKLCILIKLGAAMEKECMESVSVN